MYPKGVRQTFYDETFRHITTYTRLSLSIVSCMSCTLRFENWIDWDSFSWLLRLYSLQELLRLLSGLLLTLFVWLSQFLMRLEGYNVVSIIGEWPNTQFIGIRKAINVIKSIFYKNILENPSHTKNLQGLPRWFCAKSTGSPCKFFVWDGFSSMLL